MILGIKSRWNQLNNVIHLSNHVELHLELEDINELINEQVKELSKHDKTYHLHAPLYNEHEEFVDFVKDFKLFKKCIKLGDKINKEKYHIVCHASSSNNLEKISKRVNEAINQSSKAVLCFENRYHNKAFTKPDEFKKLFNTNENAMMCLDVCHAYLNPKPLFNEYLKFKPRIKHAHLADVGKNFEHGAQIGEGIINFKEIISKLPKKTILIPEVSKGHLNNNEGLIIAFNRLKKYLTP